jgi:DNA-binding YbaB/EbfC family protein
MMKGMNNKNLLKQAQQMQQRMSKIQEELDQTSVEGSAGGGVVKVVVTGKLKVQSVEISPDAVDPEDVELLQDLVQAAVNEAMEKAQTLAQDKMAAVTGGLSIPGLM